MANIYWNGPKASKDDLRLGLMRKLVEVTDNRFTVTFQNDGSGPHACAMVERDENSDESPFKERLPPKFMGWRVLMIQVPHGYVEAFYHIDGTRKVIEE